MNQSPLAESHTANGAYFQEESGWLLPLHFGDPLQEYHAVRSHVGLFDLCSHSFLNLTGSDRVSYLQGMVSNDVNALTPGGGAHAAILDIQGKILADVRIFLAEELILVDLWEPLRENIVAHLQRHLIAEDVEITDLAGKTGMVSLQGAEARLLMRELVPRDEIPQKELDHRPFHIDGTEVLVIRSTHTTEGGYDLLIGTKDLLQVVSRIEEIGKKFSLRWVGTQAQEILRIETGIPRYGVDMDDNNLLLETGLDHAVSFEKGCYLGQEVVERIRSRGHVNRKLVGMLLEGDTPAQRDDPITVEEKEIGRVTSSALSPARRRPLALGYIQRDYIQPGTRVSIRRHGKAIPAEVFSLPFGSDKPSLPLIDPFEPPPADKIVKMDPTKKGALEMTDFVKLCKTSDVPLGSGRTVEVNGKPIAVFNVDGHFYAISNTCLHRGGPLGEGELDGKVVTCPWHGWRYDVTSGVNQINPAVVVEKFEVKIEGDDLFVAA